MKRRILEIYSFETVDNGLMKGLAKAATDFMGFQAELSGVLETPLEAFNGRRQQYKAKPMLQSLADTRTTGESTLVLGVTELDISVPGLNFVFGVADCKLDTAVISLARLRPAYYGDGPDMQLVEERAAKEAIHELGHLLNLNHCNQAGCVMRFSSNIVDTDAKGPGFCKRCLWKLASVI